MKKTIIVLFIITFVFEITISSILFNKIKTIKQDTIKINECVKSIENNYGNPNAYGKDLEYTIIDNENNIVYKTDNSKSNSLNKAIENNDIILDLKVNDMIVGKIFIKNDINDLINNYKKKLYMTIIIISFIQLLLIIIYQIYLNNHIVKPFNDLNNFALRVASGNLDIPLYMDKNHLFGHFTEAFDLMRSELKKSRINEKRANDAKKEMVLKLSHDIKTPIASIKSTSEIGYEKASDDIVKNYFNQINIKTDQVKLLVDNLFNSSISDINEIEVKPSKYDADILSKLIKNADYLNKLNEFTIPQCHIYIDKVRMQQVFDNIINNSYKYAKTNIDIKIIKEDEYLKIIFRDYGPGVDEYDLPFLKDKYKRGSNVKDEDGAGLGLYLVNYFMQNMNGMLDIKNSNPGFEVIVYIRII